MNTIDLLMLARLAPDVQEFLDSLGMFGWRLGLDRMHALLEHLDRPERRFASIHIAGSNGKGSVAHLLAGIYRHAGYRVGLYTSPHLVSPVERVCIDGRPLAVEVFESLVRELRPLVEKLQATYFETLTALAFLAFARERVKVAVIETGLGGRLDATNVVTPLCSVITTISLEHQAYLGNTLAAIAGEKAGIIKPETPCVVGNMPGEAMEVIRRTCMEQRAALYEATTLMHSEVRSMSLNGMQVRMIHRPADQVLELTTPLVGRHQVANLAVAVSTCRAVQNALPVPDSAIKAGIAVTRVPGRMDYDSGPPEILLDVAHNPQSMEALVTTLQEVRSQQRWIVVMGVLSDKDYRTMLDLLRDVTEQLICVTPPSERGLPAEELLAQALRLGIPAQKAETMKEAMQRARALCAGGRSILVTGSHYVVGAYLREKAGPGKKVLT